MKKLVFAASLFFMISEPIFAGTISISPFISGNDVTIAHLEAMRTTLSNVINSNIEGGINIKAGSLVTSDFSNAVSPVTRWDEAFNDFTYTGMIPATSASLTSDISSGTSYVAGFRVVIGTTSHTYTASKDTYVYVNKGGFYNYDAVANGAAAPSNYSSTTGDLLLAIVVTSGTAITTVTDSRTTGISLSTGSNLVPTDYRSNMFVAQASTTTMTVNAGFVEVNGAKISKTTTTTLTISSASDWAGGSSLRTTSAYAYVGVDASGNIKMHTTAPTHSNYSVSTTTGTKRYATWSGTVYRIIGWFYMNATGSGELNSYEVGNLRDDNVPNQVRSVGTTDITTTDGPMTTMTDMNIHFYSSGRPITLAYGGALGVAGAGGNINLALSADAVGVIGTNTEFAVARSGLSGHYQYPLLDTSSYAQGTHNFTVTWGGSDGATTEYQDGTKYNRAFCIIEN